ncbi:GPI-anchor transamidase [Phakopsora pachyrhizi]|uniref:GPI-anchor transamidase n=1 Tax=Phakopsora pachyrhizi TaxID=170000 RepID=A0AAV0BTZ7_PHAPC|nr:GPI-anchor transamidase [Phakopsora pachyrhizi]
MRNHHHHSVSSFYQTGRWIDLNILLSVIIILIIISPGRVDGLDHSNNWAVLICTSRFWYRSVKRLGIPDSNIILMLADDMACNPRNMFPGTVYSNADRKLDLYGDQIEVDYRGDEVSVENFIRLLTGRVAEGTPRSKRLMTDERSNVLVYMTGHGGEEFLKFQDSEEISAFDLADAFQTMWAKNRYNQLLFMIDTCQANTMLTKFYSPNIIATGSSAKGENSYSHHADSDIGVAVVDRFSHFVLSYLENMNKTSQLTMQDFVNSYSYEECHSTPEARTDLMERPLREILMTDFFGGVSTVEVSDSTLRLKIEEEEKKMDPQGEGQRMRRL